MLSKDTASGAWSSLHQVLSQSQHPFHQGISMKLSSRTSPESVARAAITAVHFLGEFGKNDTTFFLAFPSDCGDLRATRFCTSIWTAFCLFFCQVFSHSFPVSHSFIFFLYFTQDYLLCHFPLVISSPFHISLHLTLTWHCSVASSLWLRGTWLL